MRFLTIFLFLLSSSLSAEVDWRTHELSFEYGLAYHTLKSVQKNNNTSGRLTTNQNPYWLGGYTLRVGRNYGLRFFGGLSVIRFEEPTGGELITEFDTLTTLGLELIKKTGPNSKFGIFLMEQEHPLYRAITPTEFEVFKLKFAQAGVHLQLGQRRRVGLLWGLGIKGYALFPSRGGDVATETGVGGEVYGRLGWVGPLGTLHQIKGFYQGSTAPNADVNFSHEVLAYSYQISFSY